MADYSPVVVDWAYTYNPFSYLLSLGKEGDWLDSMIGDRAQFLNFKAGHREYIEPGYDIYFDTEMAKWVYFDKSNPNRVWYAQWGLYSLYDVLDPGFGTIVSVAKPQRKIHELSSVRPLMCYQDNAWGRWFQWDNLGLSLGPLDAQMLDMVIRTRNLALPSVETTGQTDVLHPPGYSTSDVTGVSDVPYITSWERVSTSTGDAYQIRWSDGRVEVSSVKPITGVEKNKIYTLEDTVNVDVISYQENGALNTSTTNIFPATIDVSRVYAKSASAGHEPWKAFNSSQSDGWLSADGDTENVWLIYDFGSTGAVINKWRFCAHPTVPNSSPKRFTIDGSNSVSWSSWDVLFARYAEGMYKPLSPGEWSEWFTFSNGVSYRYYRLFILESWASYL